MVYPAHIIYSVCQEYRDLAMRDLKEDIMFINKIGTQHLEIGKNCQDYGLEKGRFKLVCDGCSEGEHSEIGAKSYCHLANLGFGINQIFKKLIEIFGQSTSSIKNFLCFTILNVTFLLPLKIKGSRETFSNN